MTDQRTRWNERYSQSINNPVEDKPAFVLTQYAHLLPNAGAALDLACGLGANALFLAQTEAERRLEVVAWDISDVAIERLRQQVKLSGLAVHAEVRDVVARPPEPDQFDVIVVSHFLERLIIPHLTAALKPGGLIYYQTFIRNKAPGVGPDNPAFLLADNELLQLFRGLKVLAYREDGVQGNVTRGFRNEAMLVAQNPKSGATVDKLNLNT